jgi:hypothetical protein
MLMPVSVLGKKRAISKERRSKTCTGSEQAPSGPGYKHSYSTLFAVQTKRRAERGLVPSLRLDIDSGTNGAIYS